MSSGAPFAQARSGIEMPRDRGRGEVARTDIAPRLQRFDPHDDDRLLAERPELADDPIRLDTQTRGGSRDDRYRGRTGRAERRRAEPVGLGPADAQLARVGQAHAERPRFEFMDDLAEFGHDQH